MTPRLLDLTARAHPDGHRVDLSWQFSADSPVDAGVRVLRRERTFPSSPDDGVRVGDRRGLREVQDDQLDGETTYYYALFPYAGTPPAFDTDTTYQVSAMATSRYDLAGLMYSLLPAIYRRYDVPPDDGFLRHFLDLPGGQLDQIYSLTRAALGLHDVNRVDAALLPLLAEWIGWRTDHGVRVGTQRNQIAFAPQLYRVVGGTPAVDAAVALVLGWPSRTKEYVHNVARTNQPEVLTLWGTRRDSAGTWGPAEQLSVNAVHDGHTTHVRSPAGLELLLFHVRRRHGWQIWAKRRAVPGPLDGAGGPAPVPSEAAGWTPSEPVVDVPGDHKNPVAAPHSGQVWMFWETFGIAPPGSPPGLSAAAHWRVAFAVHDGATWSRPSVFSEPMTERRSPAVTADGSGGLWLFWRERVDGGWALRYNRHDGTRWQLDPPATLAAGGPGPDVEDDLAAGFDPGSPGRPLWLFWSGHVPGPRGQTRWQVGWRSKGSLDPTATDWSPPGTVPKAAPGDHDREPAPLFGQDGSVELFWSSTRDGGWAVVRAVLDTALAWNEPVVVTPGPFSRRSPVPVTSAAGTLLAFRSNRSVVRATGTAADSQLPRSLDVRYAGTTTVRSADGAKRALYGTFEDFQTYMYRGVPTGGPGESTNRSAGRPAARDAIGVFLQPDTADPDRRAQGLERLRSVLPDFLPLTTRVVFVVP